MTKSFFNQLNAILWKVVLQKWAQWGGFLAELLLPVAFMGLLIFIKNISTVYNSPNIAYYCGNTFPWYYTQSVDWYSIIPRDWVDVIPLTCTQKPDTCSVGHFYQAGVVETQDYAYAADFNVSIYSQLGFVQSPLSSGSAENPFYAFTVGDDSSFYDNYYLELDNPSKPLCEVIQRVYYNYAEIAIAPASEDGVLTFFANNLVYFLRTECNNYYYYAVNFYSSQAAVDDFITSKDYDNGGLKVAFAIIINQADKTNGQWDYSIRANYTSIFNQGEKTTACLYNGCDFKYTIPSTKFYTYDLLKPQSTEYMYGYSYSGFLTLQVAVDRYIFNEYNSLRGIYNTEVSATVGMMPTAAYESDNFQYIISSTLGIFYMLSFLYPVSRIVRAVVLDKELRIKEGMKMMGLTDTVYNLSWLITVLLQMTVVSILITLITASSVFEYSNKVYVFFYFEVFSIAVMNMCFLMATLFSRSKTAALLGPVIFFATFFPYYAVNDPQFESSAKSATCLLAPACFALGADVFAQFEGGLVGVQTTNINQEANNFTYSACVGMMIFDAFLYGFLAWYIDKVLPSEYGTSLPWYFPFLPSYWCSSAFTTSRLKTKKRTWYGWLTGEAQYHELTAEDRLQEQLINDGEVGTDDENIVDLIIAQQQKKTGRFFEELSPEMVQQIRDERCLVTKKLRRVFKNAAGGEDKVAVHGLTLPLFEGQINVLLGHNGAGKTTTISMLVGMIPASTGDAFMPGGLSVTQDMQQIRSILGVCPQHDILFPDLTALQHLEIFAAFKGVPRSQIRTEASKMLEEVGLAEKAHTRSAALSGGQKRKLSLGIALIGDSKVVILDEPTSGMDPYSRRATWNIIQRNKRGRVILLTTHFMDEADILGDRVSIMADGKLQCSGSPLYLKKSYGVGYTLTIARPVTTENAATATDNRNSSAEALVEELVLTHVPEAQVLSKVGAEQSYRLPLSASAEFVKLFQQLDSLRVDAVINEYGISVTTMEEVFMKVADAGHYEAIQQENNANKPSGEGLNTTINNALLTDASHSEAIRGNRPHLQSIDLDDQRESGAATVMPGTAKPKKAEDGTLHISAIQGTDQQQQQTLVDPERQVGLQSDLDDVETHERLAKQKAHAKKQMSCIGMFTRHVSALVIKRAIYAKRDRRLIVCQLLLPVLLVIVGLGLLLIAPHGEQPDLILNGAKYNPSYAESTRNYVPILKQPGCVGECALVAQRFQSQGNTNNGVAAIGIDVNKIIEDPATSSAANDAFSGCAQGAKVLHDMSNVLLQFPENVLDDVGGRSIYGAITLGNDTSSSHLEYNMLINGSTAHGAGVYMNLVHTAYLQTISKIPGATITARNHPLPLTYDQKRQSNTISAFVAALFCMIAFCFVPASFAVFVVREREVKAQHQQLISGVSGAAYWLSTWIWDSCSYMITAGAILGCFLLFDVTAYVANDAGIAVAGLLILFGPAAAAHTYLICFFFKSHSTAQVAIMFYTFLTGLCLMVVSFVLTQIPKTSHQEVSLRYFFRLFPAFCLGDGLAQLALCTNGQDCPIINGKGYDVSAGTQGPLAWDITGGSLVFLALQAVVAFPLTILIEYLRQRSFVQVDILHAQIREWIFGVLCCCFGGPSKDTLTSQAMLQASVVSAEEVLMEDDDVTAERRRVLDLQRRGDTSDVVRLIDLRKVFFTSVVPTSANKNSSASAAAVAGTVNNQSSAANTVANTGANAQIKVAVKGLSFGVPLGECFGFLGINGAGKTTTMSILTGDLTATSGSAFIAGENVTKDQSKGLRKQGLIGYCPQFDALLDLLTAREHLELFGRIQGLSGALLQESVEHKLREMDLKDHAHKISSSLSGGNRRKLSVAVATMHDPSVLFLDEPSTGMDPMARRFMWRVISRLSARCSVMLTTHSMEEAEALCHRIGIMVNGTLRCLGSAQHLKNRFGQGIELSLKINAPSDEELWSRAGVLWPLAHLPNGAPVSSLLRNTASNSNSTEDAQQQQLRVLLEEGVLSWSQLSQAVQLVTSTTTAGGDAAADFSPVLQRSLMLSTAQALSTTAVSTSSLSNNNAASFVPVRALLQYLETERRYAQVHAFLVQTFNRAPFVALTLDANNTATASANNVTSALMNMRDSAASTSSTTTASDGAVHLIERSAQHSCKYRLLLDTTSQPENGGLSQLFSVLEAEKDRLFVGEYSAGQTTLEQIFNHFAAQQTVDPRAPHAGSQARTSTIVITN